MDTLDTPSYISSRSANSLISFSRPTRIQAITLHYLNKILDELLLLILTSAKSLATDRIKSDGILRVLGGQSGSGSGAGALLAKNAVLEAELELRSFLDGQRKEGGKMPLGLSATSRWDGTESFPVQSAYKALRIRCQYYSTLGELEDPSPQSPQDQNIMSSDGRPIATITPGVAIYVTALLEFVAEYILQNVARVIERDNSDEATLNDLIKAMEEDEGTLFWWAKMQIKGEIISRQREQSGGHGKVQKPWHVPNANELDQAAGRKKFQRQSLSVLPSTSNASSLPSVTTPSSAHDRTFSSGQLTDLRDGLGGATSPTLSGHTHTTGLTSMPSSTEGSTLKRRTSFDRGWFLGGKRRGSFRSSQDLSASILTSSDRTASSSAALAPKDVNGSQQPGVEGGTDFDSLVMSGQTMKVSLTPNRLRSMDASAENGDGDEARRSARRRPGTGTLRPDSGEAMRSPSGRSIPSAQSDNTHESGEQANRSSTVRPASSRGFYKGAPPSSYRGVEPDPRASSVQTPDPTMRASMADDEGEEGSSRLSHSQDLSQAASGSVSSSLLPRDEKRKSAGVREMVDAINNTSPPSPMTEGTFPAPSNGRESRLSLASQTSTETSRRMTLGSAGGKVLGLFGRKSSSTASPNPSINTTGSRNLSSDRPSLAKTFSEDSSIVAHQSALSSSHVSRPERNGGNSTFAAGASAAAAAAAAPASVPAPSSADAHHGSRSPELDLRNRSDIDHESKSGGSGWTNDSAAPVTSSAVTDDSHDGRLISPSGTGELYQNARANASASTLSSTTAHHTSRGDVASRKVPWSYNRQSSSGRRGSGPLIGSARIGSGSSSQGHGIEPAIGPPPSAWSQNSFAIDTGAANGAATDASTAALGNRTPTVGASPTFGRTSPSPRPFGSSKSDAARLLVQLNQRMRECNSVEECQRLVTQALAVAAAAVHSEHDSPALSNGSAARVIGSPKSQLNRPVSIGDIPDEETSHDQLNSKENRLSKEGRSTEQALLYSVPAFRPIKYRNIALPMAVGYNAAEDDSLPLFRRQSMVASWLLDGEGEEPRPEALALGSEQALPGKKELSRQTSSSSVGRESDFASADERPRHPVATAANKEQAPSSAVQDSVPHNDGGKPRPTRTPRARVPVPTMNDQSGAAKTGANGNGNGNGPYQSPTASHSGTAVTSFDSGEERRVSTVSSTYSNYRDAEDGGQQEEVTVN